MVSLKPFRAYRPKKELAKKVACFPYDVLSSAEAKELAKGNPASFYHIDKPEIDLPDDMNPYSPEVYKKGQENFQKFLLEKILFRDDKPCFYVYRQKMGDHVQTGVVAGASVAEYDNGIIKKHELTRPDKEDDRVNHIKTVKAQVGPVFLTYHADKSIGVLVDEICNGEPEYDFVSEDGIKHTCWVVSDSHIIDAIEKSFAKVSCLYVADGHHRSAAASRIKCSRFLTVTFPHDQMQIMPYNRVVKDLNGLTPDQFLKRVEEKFEISNAIRPNPSDAKSFGMFLKAKWYSLKARPGTYPTSDPVNSLDVAILQNNLLEPILGISDPRKDKRIDFVGGIRGTRELEKRVKEGCAVAFCCYPTSIEQLMSVADAGLLMPPKSTWFEPKLRSGLFCLGLDE